MKSYRPIKFLVSCIGDTHPGRGKRVLLTLCAGAILFSGVTAALARGFARGGGGARGAGVAPGVGAGAPGVGATPGAGVGAPGAGALPNGYVYVVPANYTYTTVIHDGSTCYYANGVWYCPVYYEGNIVYTVTQ